MATWSALASPGEPGMKPVQAALQLLSSPRVFSECPDSALVGVLGPSVALLEDDRVIKDESAVDGQRLLVRGGALMILQRLTGRSLGPVVKPISMHSIFDRKVAQEQQAAAAARVLAWRDWWKAKPDALSELASGRRRDELAAKADLAALETRLRGSRFRVLRAWKVLPWVEPLTAKNAGITETAWGGYVKRDGALFRVSDSNRGNGVHTLDTSPVRPCERFADAELPQHAAVRWSYGGEVPLAGLATGARFEFPATLLNDLAASEPQFYEHLLQTAHLALTAVDGDTVLRLAIEAPALPARSR